MKVIRHQRHADRVMKTEGALAVGGIVGGILLWSQAYHFGGYGFAGAAFLSLMGINAGVRALRVYNRYYRGIEGEEAALADLKPLGDDYVAVMNFVVPGTRQGDTDLLVLGPFGVLVLEVKAYTGRCGCQGDQWYCVRPDGTRQALRSSVSRQVKRGRKAIQHYLVDCDLQVPVHSAAVFRPTAQLELDHPTVPVLLSPDLPDHIRHLPPAHRLPPLPDLEACFRPE